MFRPTSLSLFALLCSLAGSHAAPLLSERSLSESVLSATRSMPEGGRYAASSAATRALESSVGRTPTNLALVPQRATPSYCSSATFLVFLSVIQQLVADGRIHLEPEVLEKLLARGQRDGEGVWGRWNANGPGTARLFAELDLGPNFTSFSEARQGDFMKIFWTSEVGMRERGHSVVFLGTENVAGTEMVRFWSSNQPLGYGTKSVPRAKIAMAIFSRLERPENLARIGSLPRSDRYLAGLLNNASSLTEVGRMCKFSP